jgi:hypothetical protein
METLLEGSNAMLQRIGMLDLPYVRRTADGFQPHHRPR